MILFPYMVSINKRVFATPIFLKRLPPPNPPS
jgi:hypothetical protein